MKRKLLSLILCLCLAVSLIPAPVAVAQGTEAPAGEPVENITKQAESKDKNIELQPSATPTAAVKAKDNISKKSIDNKTTISMPKKAALGSTQNEPYILDGSNYLIDAFAERSSGGIIEVVCAVEDTSSYGNTIEITNHIELKIDPDCTLKGVLWIAFSENGHLTISGEGNFAAEIYCVDNDENISVPTGYDLIKTGDIYTVEKKQEVVELEEEPSAGPTVVTTAQELKDALAAGGDIVLGANIDLGLSADDLITVNPISLHLNSFKIVASYFVSVFRIRSNMEICGEGEIINSKYNGSIFVVQNIPELGYFGNLAITGGTFSQNVSAYCADGYECKSNGDGTWTVHKSVHNVCEINGQGYETLEDAVNAVRNGETITLIDNITLTGETEIGNSKSYFLDLNEHSIKEESLKVSSGEVTFKGNGLVNSNITIAGNAVFTSGTFAGAILGNATITGGYFNDISNVTGNNVTGGYFKNKIITQLAAGYACFETGDTDYPYMVQLADAQAINENTGKRYATLSEAINEAAATQTIKLLDNITGVSSGINIDKAITLNLNGKTISGKATTLITASANSGTVTITNGTLINTDTGVSAEAIAAIALSDGGLEATNLTIRVTAELKDAYGIRCNSGKTDVNIINCDITAASNTPRAYGVYFPDTFQRNATVTGTTIFISTQGNDDFGRCVCVDGSNANTVVTIGDADYQTATCYFQAFHNNKATATLNTNVLENRANLPFKVYSGHFNYDVSKYLVIGSDGKHVSVQRITADPVYPYVVEKAETENQAQIINPDGTEGAKFATLKEAVGALYAQGLSSGYTIRILMDITNNFTVAIPNFDGIYDYTIDINGFTYLYNGGKTAFSFAGSSDNTTNTTAVTVKNGVVYMADNTQVGFENTGDVTLSGVYLYKIGYESSADWPAFQNSKSGSITIHGGNYHGAIVNNGASAKVQIDSGYFQNDVSDYLLSSAYECVPSEAYSAQGYGYIVKTKAPEGAEAEVNGHQYATLAEAISNAPDGAEIKLLRDIVVSSSLDVEKNLSINLNGFTVSSSGSLEQLIKVSNNSGLTIKGDSGTLTNLNGNHAINVAANSSVSIEGGASADGLVSAVNGEGNLTINTSGTIKSLNFNGPTTVNKGTFQSTASFGAKATVSGGSFASKVVFKDEATVSGGQYTGAVDITGSKNATISGGTYSYMVTLGTTGTVNITGGRFRHELKATAGTVNISGDGTVVASGIVDGATATINGGTFTGDLIANKGTVTITRGDFKQAEDIEVKNGATAHVEGGSFTAASFVAGTGATLVITGGDFDRDVSAFIDTTTLECNKHRDGRYYVSLKTDNVARIGTTEYPTLQAAIAAVNDGETIEVIKNITVNSTDPDNMTIKFNNGKQFTVDFGESVIVTATGKNNEISNGSNVTFKNGELNAFIETKDTSMLTVESGYYHRNTESTGSDTVFEGNNITVKGGYFPGNPFTSGGTVSPGTDCNAHQLDDQPYLNYYYYIVTNKKDDVAQIGNNTYYSIKEAITAASESGNTITLLKDINESKTININKNVSINLKGHTISSTAAIAIIIVKDKSVSLASGTIESHSTNLDRIVDNAGALQLEGVNIECNDADGSGYISGIFNEANASVEMNGGKIIFNVPTKRSARPFSNSGSAILRNVNLSIEASEIGEEVDGIANFGTLILDSVNVTENCSGGGTTCGIYTQGAINAEKANVSITRTGAGPTWGIYKTGNDAASLKDSTINIVANDRNNSIAAMDVINEGNIVIENSVLRGVSNGAVIGLNLQSNPEIEISGSTIIADSANSDSSCINAKYAEFIINDGHYYASQAGSSSATKANVFGTNFKGKVFGGFFTQDVKDYLGGPEYSCEACTEEITTCGTKYTLTYKVELNAVAKIVKPNGVTKAYKYFNTVEEENDQKQKITVVGALDEVQTGDTLIVLKDYTAGENLPLLTAYIDATYTFNLNGHKIVGKTEQGTDRGVLSIEKGNVLVVDIITGDASGEPFGQIVNTNTDITECAVYVTGGATLEIPDGCFGTSFNADTADSIMVDNTTGTLNGTISAYGGFYSHEVKPEYIKEGYECVPNHEVSRLTLGEVPYKWRIQPTAGDNVAINEELNILYPTLQEAFDNVTAPGQHIRLLKNIDSISRLTYEAASTTATLEGKSAYLKLDNFTIKVSSSSRVIRVGTAAYSSELGLIGPGIISNDSQDANSKAIAVYGPQNNPSKLIVDDSSHSISIAGVTATEAGLMADVDGKLTPFPGEIEITGGRYTGHIAMQKGSGGTYKITGGYYTEDVDHGDEHFDDSDNCFVVESYYSIDNPDKANPVFEPYSHKVVYDPEAEIVETGEKGLLSRMLNNAVTGYTVQLLRDVTNPSAKVDPRCDKLCPKGNYGNSKEIGLDLNGYKIISNSVVFTGGYITDTSDGNVGAVKATGDYVRVPTGTDNGGNLPIKLGDGYHFYEVKPARTMNYVSPYKDLYFKMAYTGTDLENALAALKSLENDKAGGLTLAHRIWFTSPEGREPVSVYIHEGDTVKTYTTDQTFDIILSNWLKTYGETKLYPTMHFYSLSGIEDFTIFDLAITTSDTGYKSQTKEASKTVVPIVGEN